MPEQKLTWEQIPLHIRLIIRTYCADPKLLQLQMANSMMEVIKLDLEKAYEDGVIAGTKNDIEADDFETWYQNTYLK